MGKRCGYCQHRRGSQCTLAGAYVSPRTDAAMCRDYVRRPTIGEIQARLRREGLAVHVLRLEEQPDGARVVQLAAGLEAEARTRVYELAGIRLAPVQPVAVSDHEQEQSQAAPKQRAGGQAA
ncbi:hypothetical protein D6C00_13895 [Thiohalobacter thiocyanaticus]|uniref:Uncharacterized protein n=1 Tax=Thiohalobacter thiocyanaticus TaxID=585455 RepID=A0A426QMC5_9GAMM|nr:hypothetical protein D6C00_13895 [Thiohalobacter thiocyanaticus]